MCILVLLELCVNFRFRASINSTTMCDFFPQSVNNFSAKNLAPIEK